MKLSDALAVAGAFTVAAGAAMFKLAAGVIVLGLFLILGAVATARKPTVEKPQGGKTA